MKADESKWVCPNDRQLSLRAKLSAGWCVRASGKASLKESINGALSPEELEHIRKIIKKAEVLDKVEQDRIGFLVQQLEIMVAKSMGDGVNCCLLCSEKFGKLSRTQEVVCTECKKKVCEKCCIDYTSGKNLRDLKLQLNQQTSVPRLWLCKICSQNKEVWKRSGAWFFKKMPSHSTTSESDNTSIHESDKTSSTHYLTPVDSLHAHHRTLSGNSVTSFQWSKPTARNDSSSESEDESSDDDGITLGKTIKANGNISDKKSLSDNETRSANFPTDSDDSHSTTGVNRNGSLRNVVKKNPSNGSDHLPRHFPFQPIKTKEQDVQSIDSRVTDLSTEDGVEVLGSPMSEDTTSVASEQYSKSAMDLQPEGERGYLEFSILYDPVKSALHVNIIKATGLLAKDTNGYSDPYVKLHLLPGDGRATKLRTKTKWKTLNPSFNEKLSYYGILEHELEHRVLRLSVLDEDRFGQNDFLGEARVNLNTISSAQTKQFNMPLQHMQLLDSNDKVATDSGRIQIGLRYSNKEQALMVTVIRCSNLLSRNSNGLCNSFVKCSLQIDSRAPVSYKTTLKKKNCNPEFNKEMKFKTTSDKGHAEIARGNLTISVYEVTRQGTKQYIIGSVVLGINSDGPRLKHWFNCLKNQDKVFEEWHILNSGKPN